MTQTSDRPIRVLGIAGSLRAGSYNKAALRTALELVPEGMTIETFDIAPIPIYNADTATPPPPAVAELIAKVTAANAILFVTPEYNFSIPGGLKNAIDWFSRDPNKGYAGKAVGIMGAAGGPLGTARAQYHLRQTCVFLDMHPVNKPEVFIGNAATKFDAQGHLTDETTKGFIAQLLVALRDWARRIGS
jgi:chromate reductase